MATSIVKINDIGTIEYICNNIDDLNNINVRDIRPGSTVYCIKEKKNYILSNDKKWKTYVKDLCEECGEGGGGNIDPGYPEPKGTYYIDENGTYNIKDYAKVDVDVYSFYPSGTRNINSNGRYDVYNYEYVDVNIPQPEGVMSVRYDTNTNTLYLRDDGEEA